MYIYEHGEVGPPVADAWEMIITEAGKSRVQKRSQTGEGPDRNPTIRGASEKIDTSRWYLAVALASYYAPEFGVQ